MFRTLLQRLSAQDMLVAVRRDAFEEAELRGFVEAVSKTYVLLAVVGHRAAYDGLTVIRQADITQMVWATDTLVAWGQQVQPLDRPTLGSTQLDTWESIIVAAAREWAVVSLHLEAHDGTTSYSVRNVSVARGLVVAERITPEGVADGHLAVPTDRITRIDFGGSYEAALMRILGIQHRGEPVDGVPTEPTLAPADPSGLDTLVTG